MIYEFEKTEDELDLVELLEQVKTSGNTSRRIGKDDWSSEYGTSVELLNVIALDRSLHSQNSSDLDRTNSVQGLLIHMMHADECQRQELSGAYSICCYKYCKAMKSLLDHLRICENDTCEKPFCSTAKIVITHWRKCKNDKCSMCSPIKQIIAGFEDIKKCMNTFI